MFTSFSIAGIDAPEERLRLRESHDFAESELENVHPAVRVHPETGRKALFATSAYFKRFVGWSEDESRALLNYLQSLAQHLASARLGLPVPIMATLYAVLKPFAGGAPRSA